MTVLKPLRQTPPTKNSFQKEYSNNIYAEKSICVSAVGQHHILWAAPFLRSCGWLWGGAGTRTRNPINPKNSKHVHDVRVLGFSLCQNQKRGHWFRGPEENCTQLVFRDVLRMMIMETYFLTLFSKNQSMSAMSAF